MGLEITQLPEYAFLKGIACQDVVQIRILTSEEKKKRKWGEPDVEVKSLWFRNALKRETGSSVEYIQRSLANKKFKTTDGKALSSRFLRSGKKYLVVASLDNIPVYVLPPVTKGNEVYAINGVDMPRDVYLVFVKSNGMIFFDMPIMLSPDYFNRMIHLCDSVKSLKKRIRRIVTAVTDRKEAQYRVVAKAVEDESYLHLGYILSYLQENGKYKEQFCTNAQIKKLLEANNIRNMKIKQGMTGEQVVLTYGRILDLPTHYIKKKQVE